MFLRSTLVKSGDKKIRYWKLVENYHTERGTRQRVVAHLGSLENFTAEDWQRLAERLNQPDMAAALEYRVKNVRRGRPGTRQKPYEPGDGESAVSVYLDSLLWENPRRFGDVYAALCFWQRLGLGELFSKLFRGRSADINSLVAALMGVSRLIEPTSEVGMLGWWRKTALPELLGLPIEKVDDNRLYRCLDVILSKKEQIEEHLARRGQEMYGREYVTLLYDLTSTYFEGMAEGVEKAKRGYSRDSRPDAKQVCIGMVVDWDGYPVGYEVFEGNVRDHATVSLTLKKLEERFGISTPTVCMDRGMITGETLGLLREGYRWIVSESRQKAREYARIADSGRWQVIRRDETGAPLIEVQEVESKEGERLILVRSAGCAKKERGIHDRIFERMREDLESLAVRVESGRLKAPAKIERAIGRIMERYPGMSRWVTVKVKESDGKARIEWQVKPEFASDVWEMEGIYALRTNLSEQSPEDIWKGYMTLTRVESTFRNLKKELRLRPIFHQKGDRVEAHILLSYIAYVLLWCIEHTHRLHGGTLTGRRVLDVLSGIELATITIRAVDGRKIFLERISSPRAEESQVLHTLGIRLPRNPKAQKPHNLQLSLIDSGDQF